MWFIRACVFVLLANVASSNQRYGDCSTAHEAKLIWQYAIHRTPNIVHSQTAEAQYGPTSATIACIDVVSIGEDSGEAGIVSGGVGRDYVKFNFIANRGRPLNLKVLMYEN